MDYGFVFIGDSLRMSFFHLPYPDPPRDGCEGEITVVEDAPVPDASAVYHSIEPGDTSGSALHNLINSNPDVWLRCYQVELK